ncbi:MAG TPA: HAD-IIB family hydrolase, partial [Candidatus Eisenbacteria bacterium]|nr:HAD-IIB family hydrolase [Candidatus Eisenbacteria bacterium]
MSDFNSIITKLEQQEGNPKILFTDIDGTLFSPNADILTAPIFNAQTALFLKKHHIPFIIVTGRSFWRRIDRYHMTLLCVPQPDLVVSANGSILFYKHNDTYNSDFSWQGYMQSTKVTNAMGAVTSWSKLDITNTITNYLQENNFPFFLGQGNTYLIRIRLDKYSMHSVERIKKDIQNLFPKGIRVILTEKLLWKNSLDVFSGEMLITPSTAGKDKAVQYILKNLSADLRKPIRALIFGDATVDIPMLTMKEDPSYYTLSQYLIHPTPMAEKVAKENMKVNSNLHILYGDGPKEILWTLRPELRKEIRSEFVVHSSSEETGSFAGVARDGEPQNSSAVNGMNEASFGAGERQDPSRDKLTIAQNNPSRKVIQSFEKLLDRIVDKNLSPNEVSFLGLQKLSRGLIFLNKKNSSVVDKTKGLYHYSFGNLTDILDGIRARNSDKKEENGQLVDGFADRVKEFMQLYVRGQKRLKNDNEQALTTFLSCISCALPSIARAQVEISGKTVSERDEQGGSMIDRTKRLFLSLVFDTLGFVDQSYAKDLE